MKSLRILIVTRSLPDHGLGGMEAVAWDISKGLAAHGHTVSVLTTQTETLQQATHKDGVLIDPLKVPSGRYSSEWWRESLSVFRNKYAEKTDVVLSVSAGAMSIAEWAAKYKPDITLLVQAHGTAWGEVLSKIRTRSLLDKLKAGKNIISLWHDRKFRNLDAFVAVGPIVTRDIKAPPTRWIVGNKPVHEILNGIDTALFRFDPAAREETRKTHGLLPQHKVVLSVSRLHPQKGVAEGLQGFALAAQTDPDLRYIIAGSGPAEQDLKNMAHTLNISDKVVFTGPIPRGDLPALYCAGDLFLFPTVRQEGLPLNVLEALACGLPCILSHHINKDAFGATGINPNSPQDIADAITQCTPPEPTARPSRLPADYALDTALKKYEDVMNMYANQSTKA